MQVISKKAYRFSLYDGMERLKTVEVEPYIFKSIPDWAQNDPLFKLALKSGNISIVGAAGNSNLDAVSALLTEAKQLGIKSPGTMTLDQIQKAIADIKQGNPNSDLNDDGSPDGNDNKPQTGNKPSSAKNALLEEAKALGIKNTSRKNAEQLEKAIADAKKGTLSSENGNPSEFTPTDSSSNDLNPNENGGGNGNEPLS